MKEYNMRARFQELRSWLILTRYIWNAFHNGILKACHECMERREAGYMVVE